MTGDVKELIKAHAGLEREVYLDFENASPVPDEVVSAMTPYFNRTAYGNPTLTHKLGWEAYDVIMESAKKIAGFIGARNPEEINFTPGETEANNLALMGTCFGGRRKGKKIVISEIEPLSIIHVCQTLEKYGFNELVEKAKVSVIKIFIDQFKNFLVGLLIAAAIISAVIGEHIDALAIVAIIILNGVLGFIQEYRAEQALEALKRLAAPKARVRRNGREITILARELVPGDVIILEPGDRVPADARLITCTDLKIDEAMLTGESIPVKKNAAIILPEDTPVADRKNMVFMGTLATTGYGEAVVVSTGMNTEMGKIAAMVQEVEKEETPLMRRLNRFGKRIGTLIVVLCIITFVLG